MSLAELVDHLIGVDPDRDRITAAVVCARTQGEVASKVFAATARGYGQAMRWAKEHTVDDRRAWSIESSGSYGAGLASALATKGEFVIEFDHPGTRPSKDGAKSDSLDAVRAAREILGRKTWATPRSRGTREGLRTLITARDSAKLARVAAINVLKALIVTAPVDLREDLHGRPLMDLVGRCQRLRPDTPPIPSTRRQSCRCAAPRTGSGSSPMSAVSSSWRWCPWCARWHRCFSTSPESVRSWLLRSWCRGHTLAAAVTRQPSPGSAASHRWRLRQARPRLATDSHAAVTASSTVRCTP